ncbi:outer arm dynein light chain 1 protein isoform X2 [Wolffia australiana]
MEAGSPGDAEVSAKVSEKKKPSKTSVSDFARPTVSSSRRNADGSELSAVKPRVASTKSSSPVTPDGSLVKRRNSTGGLPERQKSVAALPTPLEGAASLSGKKVSTPEPVKTATLASRRSSLSSASSRVSTPEVKNTALPAARLAAKLESVKGESAKKVLAKNSASHSASKSVSSTPPGNQKKGSARSGISTSKASPASARSPVVSGGAKAGSAEKVSSVEKEKPSPKETAEPQLTVPPVVEAKSTDDVRLDLRGHRIKSLNSSELNLSQNLEFVYLRDNLLSSIEGIQALQRVKVLDLSFNHFKGNGFEPLENCKALQQLYLAGNQITSLASLPELPNLEFLSVAQNKLKSLSMKCQPRLQVLAASKNKISTLKGFPHLPVLEHLRVEENPILEMPHLEAASILLIGPTLKKFNDRDLSLEEVDLAKKYPAHAALCIRYGWELTPPDRSMESTFRFLTEYWKDHVPPGYLLKKASVDRPFEEDECRCHFIFVKDSTTSNVAELCLKYQWFIGEKTPTNFVPITGAATEVYWPKHEDIGRYIKVECTPILEGVEHSPIFAISSPVSPGTRCPKVVSLNVSGVLVEGNTIRGSAEIAWCGGPPGKCVVSWLRRRWNSSPVVIPGAEDEDYILRADDIDCSLVFMCTPVTEEGVKGETQYAMTDFVKAASPSVRNVRILGDAVEGSTIKGVGEYFGGKEGPSKFEWLREERDNGEFHVVSVGAAEYTLTKDDIDRRLSFVYIPINFEGQEGESVSVVSEKVKKASPRVSNLKIVGDVREGSKVTVTAIVTGATEASSKVQWFKSNTSTFKGESSLEAMGISKNAKAFRIPLGAFGYYLVTKFTPTAPDGESGEPVYVVSETPVETLPPSLNFLSVVGNYFEGDVLTASYGYIGGHEGASLYKWFLHESETDPGSLILEASGSLQYRITKEAIGKFVSFECTPMRDDGSIGEPKTCFGLDKIQPGSPRLLSLRIIGEAIEGVTLLADKEYWGGEEGDSLFRWYRRSSDGLENEIKDASTAHYTLSRNDIGFAIFVSCQPVRKDEARGPIVLSERVGPVLLGPPVCCSLKFLGTMMEGERLNFSASYAGGERGTCLHEWYRVKNKRFREKLSSAESLDLTLSDVGSCIELVYTPVRKDGVGGTPVTITSFLVSPAEPKGCELIIPDCLEDEEIVPQRSYYGGQEGEGIFIWYKSRRKLLDSEIHSISLSSEAVVCGKTLKYTPSLGDVGSYLVLHWVPTRIDGRKGEPFVAISNSPVAAAPPVVSAVQIRELSVGVYVGEGIYYGGYEGTSLFSWYRETNDGTVTQIDGADSTVYEVTDLDYNCRLSFGYTPVRSDSLVGALKLSDPTDVILPAIPKIEKLSISGRAVEGETLTAVIIIPETACQQNIWTNYKKEVTYQWFFVENDEDNSLSFVDLPSQRSCSFRLEFTDIGRRLRCECIATDVFGRSSKPVSAITSPIIPGVPRISKLEIEGRGFHTNLYAARGIYFGGREGKSKIQWLRSMVGSPDLISILGETGKMYEANVDDVGYRLVVVYTPVREDGMEGEPVSASTDPITVEPEVYSEVKQKVELGSMKFEVLCERNQSGKKAPGTGNLERRILEVNRKRVKVVKPGSKTSFPTTEIRGSYSPPFHVEVVRSDPHRFKVVVDGENEMELIAQSRHIRDIVVLVIRGLAQRFNSTSLNSLLKIET